MKTVILALLVFVVISHGEALTCNCGGTKNCVNPVETCSNPNDFCARVVTFVGPRPSVFKGCMESYDCLSRTIPGISVANCCRKDLCN